MLSVLNMFLFKLFRNISIIIFCCLFALSSHSFPKKKHSIIKDKIVKEDYENVYESGYYYGFLKFCNYKGSKDKNFQKRLKGLVAYTNWDLFLVFNRGIQQVDGDLYIAGHGWAGGAPNTNSTWQQKPIQWKLDLRGCDDKQSLDKAYSAMDIVVNDIVIKFLLERDNYQSNLNSLISALQTDKKDDYGSVVQKLNSAAQSYGGSGTTIASDNSTTDEYTTTDVSVEQNNSGGTKSIRSQLKELKSLFEDDLISEDDYNAKKQQLLDLL